MQKWIYKEKEIKCHECLPDGTKEIVYLITHTDGTKYIGKKTVRAIRRLKPTKEQLAVRKNYVRKELVDVPFMKYEGSSKENKGKVVSSKEILYCCNDKISATFLEAKLLFETDAIFSSIYTNKNIMGKFWDNALDGVIEKD